MSRAPTLFELSSHASAPIRDASAGYFGCPIAVTITHANAQSPYVTGFLHFWAKYVTGFNFELHCQKALRGRLSSHIKTRSTPLAKRFVLDELGNYDSLYICGVAAGPLSSRQLNNFHLPLQWSPGSRMVVMTYNGYMLNVENGVALPIPELASGWNGLSAAYTRCCNFRFCVHRFGYPSSHSHRCATLFAD